MIKNNVLGWALVGTLLFVLAPAGRAAPGLKLHVPSPDWRDQVIYFVMTDRFDDGDAGNNDQGRGEYKPGDPSRYQGGDLAGLRRRLGYIRGLGATALWITPPVANQWLAPDASSAGYHGYWAENFMRVDRHLGRLDDYRRLSDALHRAGMWLVQDIVVNHTGDFFHYGPGWSAADPAFGYRAPTPGRPSQPPFDLNDPRDPAHRRAGVYHWTPDVTDYKDPNQEHNFQMSGLDDLNTENPVVRRALRRSFGHWIREVGVDAFRVDTAFYVPPDYFDDFLNAQDAQAPGILRVARATGRRQFHVFGEGFGIDPPGQDAQSRKIESYMTGKEGRPLLPGMLNFPLYGALGDAFARGRPPAELGRRIEGMVRLHRRPHLMPSFIDNHDVDRFLAGGNEAGMKQALLALMTLPGIPVIYYGTEQGMTEQRASMFAAGAGSGGRDRFDTASPLYRAIAGMTALRRSMPVLSRGLPTVLAANGAQPGALAWRMAAAGGERATPALVVFNTADAETLLPSLDTGAAEGSLLQGVHGLQGRPQDVVVGPGGRVTLKLPPRSGQVFRVVSRRVAAGGAGQAPQPTFTLDPLAQALFEGDFAVAGSAPGVPSLRVVVDGDLAASRVVRPGPDGRWQATIDTGDMVDPGTVHTVVAWAEGRAPSAVRSFRVQRPWRVLADVADAAGDDAGPGGRYVYPSDPGWGVHRQMDLRGVRISGAGGALRVEVTLNEITTRWNPPNGFDHVALTVFIELPGRDGGSTVMPLQDARLPDGMRWHLRLRAGGWSNALFSPAGASASSEGTPVTPAAGIAVDRAAGRISFTLPASALGAPASLSGARVYVTTWDYDGGYRALSAAPQPFAVGGGGPGEAKVMDDSGVIALP